MRTEANNRVDNRTDLRSLTSVCTGHSASRMCRGRYGFLCHGGAVFSSDVLTYSCVADCRQCRTPGQDSVRGLHVHLSLSTCPSVVVCGANCQCEDPIICEREDIIPSIKQEPKLVKTSAASDKDCRQCRTPGQDAVWRPPVHLSWSALLRCAARWFPGGCSS